MGLFGLESDVYSYLHVLQVGDVEQCRPSEYQLVSVGSTQVLYLDTDWFQVLRKFNERVPRLFLRSEKLSYQ